MNRAAPPPVWTVANLRHVVSLVRRGRNPAATVYDSIGPDFFLAPAPGWLNLGLWEGPAGEDAAEAACRRLVETLAAPLPAGGDVVDVGNGLGAGDPVIAAAVRPRSLVAVNITESQLRAGRERLAAAGARRVAGDACRLPLADGVADGVISVEAAFHFASRRRFFEEARRVLRPGGLLAVSDIPTVRRPRTPLELASGVSQLRVWGLRPSAAAGPAAILREVERAGFVDVRAELVGDRVYPQALALTRTRLARDRSAPRSHRLAARLALAQLELLWRRRLIDYLLLWARVPA